MKQSELDKAKNGEEYWRVIKPQCTDYNENGSSHVTGHGPNGGRFTIAVHRHEYSKGLRRKIARDLRACGFTCFVGFILGVLMYIKFII